MIFSAEPHSAESDRCQVEQQLDGLRLGHHDGAGLRACAALSGSASKEWKMIRAVGRLPGAPARLAGR